MTSTLTPPTLQTAARETAPLTPQHDAPTDTLATLDHWSRTRAVPAADAPAGHYLEFRDEDDDAHVIPLERTVLHVGRAIASDVRLENPHISRRHAIFVRHGANVRVLDDRSQAGTFVNGRAVLSSEVHDGDVVRLGPIAMRYIVVH